MKRELMTQFANPSSLYRSKPFWAWNGKLEESELRRQIRIMKKMGMGGFFMHARVGLVTPYLSDEWFKCIGACIDEAKKTGMEAWFYDEDRWPSGAAGGLVTKDPKYRVRGLFMYEKNSLKNLKWTPDIIAVFKAEKKNDILLRSYQRLAGGRWPTTLKEREILLIFRVKPEECSSWYNNYTYLDTISHEAVRKFIEVTHTEYVRRFKDDFGKHVPGIFTDEPNYGNMMTLRDDQSISVPWTTRLPAIFKKRYDYDLLARLPEIFFDLEGKEISQARFHYHDCVTFLFVDAFARQIGTFCKRHGLAHTGHILGEETLSSQTFLVGDCMRFYEYMQAPGMDHLTECWRAYDIPKQVSSVARQFGRKTRLSEVYGAIGWDFPFSGQKALGDWQTALGINLRCQHISWYTMDGEAKRDYPASIHYQSPWWELYPKVEDYFARIHAVTGQGTEVRDLLVIHPIESAWLFCKKGFLDRPETMQYDQMLVDVRDTLLSAHIDFDYGNEEILSRHARVRLCKGQATLVVGKAVYKAVVVPPLITMRASTLALLRKFREKGGKVVFAGAPARFVDATPSGEVTELAQRCVITPMTGKKLVSAVESCRRISICDPKGNELEPVLYYLSEDREAFYLFICNSGWSHAQMKHDQLHTVRVKERTTAFPRVQIRGFADCTGRPEEWDPDDGRRYCARATRTAGGSWQIDTSLPALGSRLFVIPKKKTDNKLKPRPVFTEKRSASLKQDRWDIILSENNVLVLDQPRYRIGSGAWQPETEILRVDRAVRKKLGVPPRGGEMVQPWARPQNATMNSTGLQLAYEFKVETLPHGDLFFALEHPDRFKIRINDHLLTSDADCGWWTDISLRKIMVDPLFLRKGKNEILLEIDFNENDGLELAYLLGHFGVRLADKKAVMTSPVQQLKIGDWVKQGLPFYASNVGYACSITPSLRQGEHLFVHIPDYRGVALRITVNGQTAGILAWEPYEIDITDLLKKGANDLVIEVVGHRHNSHGPLHHAEKWQPWCGPGEFTTSGKLWRDEYQLVPCGLLQAPLLVVKHAD